MKVGAIEDVISAMIALGGIMGQADVEDWREAVERIGHQGDAQPDGCGRYLPILTSRVSRDTVNASVSQFMS